MPKPPTNATGRPDGDSPPTATVGLSDHLDTRTAAHELVERLEGPTQGPETEAVVLVVASFHHRAALGEAVETIRTGCAARHAIGMTATTVSAASPAFEDAGTVEPVGEVPGPGLAALRILVEAGTVSTVRLDLPDGPPQHWSDDSVARRFPGRGRGDMTLLLADPFTLAAGPLAERLDRSRAPGLGPLFGGLASGASIAGANALVLDGEASGTGAVGLSLGGGLTLDAFAALGAVGAGPELVITRAHAERIEELSGQPAAAAMLEAIGWNPDAASAPPLTLIGIAVDAAKPRRGRGDWRLRTVTAIGRDGSITVDEPMRAGRTVRFHRIDRDVDATDLSLLLDREQLRPPPIAAIAWCGTGRSPSDIAPLLTRRLGAPAIAAATIGEFVPIDGRPALQRRSIAVGLLRSPAARP